MWLGKGIPSTSWASVLSFAVIAPAVSLEARNYMWKRVLFVCLVVAISAFAQEGHPLSGTWTGDWGASAGSRNHLTLVMNWDGDKVTGVMNPGPDSVSLNVFVDYSTWAVRLDAEPKDDAAGKSVRIEAEGKL